MQSFFAPSRFSLFDQRHLLLLDLNSNGLFFYLAKDVKELAAIDFASLSLLKQISSDRACRGNLLADEQFVKTTLSAQLKNFDLDHYALVFLLSPNSTQLEKKTLQSLAPFLVKNTVVDRHFFYNFYLMQKRNFSQVKFIVNLFSDCAELSLFDRDKLLDHQSVELRNLAVRSKDFFQSNKNKIAFPKPDCFYLFTNNLNTKVQALDLAKYLKLEAIEIENLC